MGKDKHSLDYKHTPTSMYVCSSRSTRVAFISPNQKVLNDMLAEQFTREYLNDMVMGKTSWSIRKISSGDKEAGK